MLQTLVRVYNPISINRAATLHRNIYLWVDRSRALLSIRGYSQPGMPGTLVSLSLGARLRVFACRPMLLLTANLLGLEFI